MQVVFVFKKKFKFDFDIFKIVIKFVEVVKEVDVEICIFVDLNFVNSCKEVVEFNI